MKKKYFFTLLIAIIFIGAAYAQEIQKNFINYQGVARSADSQLMASEDMTINIGLKFGAANAASIYEESHAITTDANGVFSLMIGNGSPITGNYNALPWGRAATFITVSMNGNELGTTELMAVPYAISSGDAKQSAAEVPYDNSSSGLGATTAQEAIDVLASGGTIDTDDQALVLTGDVLTIQDGTGSVDLSMYIADADADINNELQTLDFDPATNALSLSDGNTVIIPSGGTDADADPTNELQTISFDAATHVLSLTDGGTVTIPSGGTDADADPTNEFQTLSFDAGTNELSLSNGNAVTIPSGGTDADADPTNEIQDISLAGTELTISDGSTIDLAPIIPPASTDNQNLTFNQATKVLGIEDGNTVDLSSLLGGGTGGSPWSPGTLDAIYYSAGNVGIGTTAPKNEHHIHSLTGAASTLYTLEAYGDDAIDGLSVGVADGLGAAVGFLTLREDGPLNLGTNSQTRVSIRGNGLVGIGTQAPTSKLDVDGAIRSRDLSGGGNVIADANGNLVIGSTGGGSLWQENGSNIYYNSGNIGLGLSNPQNAWMHIQTNSTVSKPQLLLEEEGYDYARLALKNDQSTAYWHIAGRPNNNGADSKLNFYHHDGTAGFDRMTILGNGNVGINTAAPTSKLDVAGDINTSGEVHRTATGSANMLPIAYGTIAPNGSILNGTGNFSVLKSSSFSGSYSISLNEGPFDRNLHTVSVTRLSFNNNSGFINAAINPPESAIRNTLIVLTRDTSNIGEDTGFSFIVYKP